MINDITSFVELVQLLNMFYNWINFSILYIKITLTLKEFVMHEDKFYS
jgi:hypothetical protein